MLVGVGAGNLLNHQGSLEQPNRILGYKNAEVVAHSCRRRCLVYLPRKRPAAPNPEPSPAMGQPQFLKVA